MIVVDILLDIACVARSHGLPLPSAPACLRMSSGPYRRCPFPCQLSSLSSCCRIVPTLVTGFFWWGKVGGWLSLLAATQCPTVWPPVHTLSLSPVFTHFLVSLCSPQSFSLVARPRWKQQARCQGHQGCPQHCWYVHSLLPSPPTLTTTPFLFLFVFIFFLLLSNSSSSLTP